MTAFIDGITAYGKPAVRGPPRWHFVSTTRVRGPEISAQYARANRAN